MSLSLATYRAAIEEADAELAEVNAKLVELGPVIRRMRKVEVCLDALRALVNDESALS